MQSGAQPSTLRRSGRRGLNLIALLVFALLFAGFEYGEHLYAKQKRQEQLAQLRDEATRIHRLLESEITTTVALGNGIESYILARQGRVLATDVEPLLAVTYERGGYFRNLGLAPDNRIEYVFPLKGNEAALGLRYQDNPKQWPGVQRAIAARRGLFDGPLNLVQGGRGLIFRQPVFIEETYWGMISAVIDADKLFGLMAPLASKPGIAVGLRHTQTPDNVFEGSAAAFGNDTIVLPMTVPGGDWELGVALVAGHSISWLVHAAALLLAGLISLILMLGVNFQWQRVANRRLERKVVERTQEIRGVNLLLSSVLDAATQVAIIATDKNGIITLFNRGAEQMLGYHADSMLGQPVPEPWSPQELPAAGDYSTHDTHERKWTRQDGSELYVWLSVTDIRDEAGERTGQLLVAMDLTERKRVERLKNEFVSTVSHELRTPLTAINGVLGLLAGGAMGALPEKIADMVEIAHKNSQRLGFMINDLLDMEKLMAGKLQFDMQQQALQPLLELAMQTNQPYADQFCVKLVLNSTTVPLDVTVDKQRFAQVMANLLSNAAKFSPTGGTVEITTTLREDNVRIAVRDHGSGIPAVFRDRIFQKFAQADSSDTRQKGGTGLGLAIMRGLVERMNGRVGFESVEGQGTTFWFELPVTRLSTASEES